MKNIVELLRESLAATETEVNDFIKHMFKSFETGGKYKTQSLDDVINVMQENYCDPDYDEKEHIINGFCNLTNNGEGDDNEITIIGDKKDPKGKFTIVDWDIC